jgi:hypothetical protein
MVFLQLCTCKEQMKIEIASKNEALKLKTSLQFQLRVKSDVNYSLTFCSLVINWQFTAYINFYLFHFDLGAWEVKFGAF